MYHFSSFRTHQHEYSFMKVETGFYIRKRPAQRAALVRSAARESGCGLGTADHVVRVAATGIHDHSHPRGPAVRVAPDVPDAVEGVAVVERAAAPPVPRDLPAGARPPEAVVRGLSCGDVQLTLSRDRRICVRAERADQLADRRSFERTHRPASDGIRLECRDGERCHQQQGERDQRGHQCVGLAVNHTTGHTLSVSCETCLKVEHDNLSCCARFNHVT